MAAKAKRDTTEALKVLIYLAVVLKPPRISRPPGRSRARRRVDP